VCLFLGFIFLLAYKSFTVFLSFNAGSKLCSSSIGARTTNCLQFSNQGKVRRVVDIYPAKGSSRRLKTLFRALTRSYKHGQVHWSNDAREGQSSARF
jgi:hypothetical protein